MWPAYGAVAGTPRQLLPPGVAAAQRAPAHHRCCLRVHRCGHVPRFHALHILPYLPRDGPVMRCSGESRAAATFWGGSCSARSSTSQRLAKNIGAEPHTDCAVAGNPGQLLPRWQLLSASQRHRIGAAGPGAGGPRPLWRPSPAQPAPRIFLAWARRGGPTALHLPHSQATSLPSALRRSAATTGAARPFHFDVASDAVGNRITPIAPWQRRIATPCHS